MRVINCTLVCDGLRMVRYDPIFCTFSRGCPDGEIVHFEVPTAAVYRDGMVRWGEVREVLEPVYQDYVEKKGKGERKGEYATEVETSGIKSGSDYQALVESWYFNNMFPIKSAKDYMNGLKRMYAPNHIDAEDMDDED